MEPAAVLVGPFQVDVCRPFQIGPVFQGESVRAAGIEPDVQDIGDLAPALDIVPTGQEPSPGTVSEPGIRAFLLQSLDVKEKRWRLNLDTLAAEMDKIVGWPEISGQFDGPALFLSGATSDYVPRDARDKIRGLFPNAVFAKIPGAGHWLHAEKPREFEANVGAFLKHT